MPRTTARSRAAKTRRQPTRGNATQAALAERILGWLRQQDLKPGDHVPERLATEAFHVSRTPVRGALTLLTTRGLLERRDQRGYFIAAGFDAADQPAAVETPETTLHDAILRDRFSKRLDAEVTAAHLARRYHASRAVVLRVLGRLQKDGVVERALGQRWVFLPALDSLRSQEDSHRFRLILEPAAFLQPGFALDARRTRDLKAALGELARQDARHFDLKRALDADIAFHEAIADACNNRFLADAMRQQSRLRRFATTSMQVPPARLIESCREHLAILEAAEAGDFVRAAELMREHLAASLRARPGFVNRGAPPMLRAALMGAR
ncbi:MAG TPA: GntR family transcriptional regulator [Dongiaceae bacterium]|nr:GntR family transcriptional regulator [Dongiaceae bacterium]